MADAFAPFVSFDNITYFRSFVSCFIIAVAYVVSLYINKCPLPRYVQGFEPFLTLVNLSVTFVAHE